MRRIPISTKEHIFYLLPNEIVFCKSNNTSTTIHLENKEIVEVSKGLMAIEKILNGTQFIRPHQSYLVNQNHIVQVDKTSDFSLVLSNQSRIPVSVRRRKTIHDIIKNGI